MLKARNSFKKLLQTTKFESLICEGSYFQMTSYATISDETDSEFTKRLVTEFGFTTMRLPPFHTDGKQTQCIRFCLAKEDNTLIEAINRLLKL
jgi:methionine transaminase